MPRRIVPRASLGFDVETGPGANSARSCTTTIDCLLAVAVLAEVVLNTTLNWWWADPAAGLILDYYAFREARTILTNDG